MDNNWIDIVFLAALTFFLITGIWKGFIKALFGLTSIVAGAFVSFSFTEQLSQKVIEQFPGAPSFTPVIVAVLLFVLSLILIQYIGKYINTLINATPLNMANRISGGALGLIKTYIFAILLFGVLEFLAPLNGGLFNTLSESQAYAAYNTIPFSPEDIYNYQAETEIGKSFTKKVTEIRESPEIRQATKANEVLEKVKEFESMRVAKDDK